MTRFEPCRHVWRYEQRGGPVRVRTCVYCGAMWVFSDDPEDYGWAQVEEAVE